MPALTDQELVAACLQGKESAYALLVERYTPRLYRIAARICRHPQDAEDAVQETLLQAVRDLRKWKPTAPLEAWLVTITVRTAQRWTSVRIGSPAALTPWMPRSQMGTRGRYRIKGAYPTPPPLRVWLTSRSGSPLPLRTYRTSTERR